MTCNYSACPARLPLCLVRRFINRTSRGRPDGCYDTVICFRGSPSSSWALVCCLLAACWSFLPATHTPVKKVKLTHLTHRWYLRILSIISSWDHPHHDQSVSGCSIVTFRECVCVCVYVCMCVNLHILKHAGSALVFIVLNYRSGCKFTAE